MAGTRQWFRKLWVYPWTGFALIIVSACNSSPASSGGREAGAAAASNNAGTHIDVMCVGDRINNPPESFHYSYVYTDASTSVDKEADITAQDMAITIKDKSGSHSYHGARSDETSWDRAVLDLSGMNITAMSSRLDSLNGTSAVVNQGADAVNNYNAEATGIMAAVAERAKRLRRTHHICRVRSSPWIRATAPSRRA